MAQENLNARHAALAQLADYECEPSAVVEFDSTGELLLTGPAEAVIAAAEKLPAQMRSQTSVVVNSPVDLTTQQHTILVNLGISTILAGKPEISGFLGHFQVRLPVAQANDPAPAGLDWVADLVLDLNVPSLIDVEVPPLGYYSGGDDLQALQRALKELPALVGTFEKPRFFRFQPEICAHGRSGIEACTRCLDTCPTQAISSDGDTIRVDANLCQGAGSCATACPTGAITYAYPSVADSLTRIRKMLAAYREAGGRDAVVLLHDSEAGAAFVDDNTEQLADFVLPYAIEELASVGMEFWLATLAYGARAIVLLDSGQLPSKVRRELSAQMSFTWALLEGMGYASNHLEMVAPERLLDLVEENLPQTIIGPAATFAGLDEKRNMIRVAVDHLFRNAPKQRPLVNLPTGAPFGEASVDSERCTLCMACVSQCPGKALQDGADLPQLKFIEANCVQCGLCCRTCPEDAISISPRYLYDHEQRHQLRILNEDAPFDCVVCGKPFATQRMIQRITVQLGGHPMFQGEALKRLKMCEDCRTRDIYNNELAQGETFPGGQQ